jgi:DNA-binding GntR family transcriptional regulator
MGASVDMAPRGSGAAERRRSELIAELVDTVLLARAAPGARMSRRAFAQLARATEAELVAILPDIVRTGLIADEGGVVVVRPLDKDAMFAALPRRMELEIAIVRAAAAGASDAELLAMQASEALQSRCAKVGDIDGMMQSERELERLLVEASGLHAEGAELKSIKQEFRRAWCDVNRLRNFTGVVNIRTALVAALVKRDPDEAEAQVRVFFDHLLRTY